MHHECYPHSNDAFSFLIHFKRSFHFTSLFLRIPHAMLFPFYVLDHQSPFSAPPPSHTHRTSLPQVLPTSYLCVAIPHPEIFLLVCLLICRGMSEYADGVTELAMKYEKYVPPTLSLPKEEGQAGVNEEKVGVKLGDVMKEPPTGSIASHNLILRYPLLTLLLIFF